MSRACSTQAVRPFIVGCNLAADEFAKQPFTFIAIAVPAGASARFRQGVRFRPGRPAAAHAAIVEGQALAMVRERLDLWTPAVAMQSRALDEEHGRSGAADLVGQPAAAMFKESCVRHGAVCRGRFFPGE